MPSDFPGASQLCEPSVRRHATRHGSSMAIRRPISTGITRAMDQTRSRSGFGAVLLRKGRGVSHLMPIYFNPRSRHCFLRSFCRASRANLLQLPATGRPLFAQLDDSRSASVRCFENHWACWPRGQVRRTLRFSTPLHGEDPREIVAVTNARCKPRRKSAKTIAKKWPQLA